MKNNKLKRNIKHLINNVGYELIPFLTVAETRLLNYINKNGITVCIDVGANTCQFAERLKKIKFQGRIYSFEPQREAFEILKENSKKYKDWEVKKGALGDVEGSVEMNIAQNSVSSSILPMLATHEKAEPDSKYIAVETVQINRLDTIIDTIAKKNEKIYLKIDTQGFEQRVLAGAEKTLERVYILQLEMSLIELYEGELLFDDMRRKVEELGFRLCSIENGFADKETGQLLQAETIFVRTNAT